jgi:hypothetical protein
MVDTDLRRGMLSLMLYVLIMIVFIDLMFVMCFVVSCKRLICQKTEIKHDRARLIANFDNDLRRVFIRNGKPTA